MQAQDARPAAWVCTAQVLQFTKAHPYMTPQSRRAKAVARRVVVQPVVVQSAAVADSAAVAADSAVADFWVAG